MGRTDMAKRMQANAEFWMNLNLRLALLMVLMGGMLRFVGRRLKEPTPVQTAIVLPLEENATKKLPFRAAGE